MKNLIGCMGLLCFAVVMLVPIGGYWLLTESDTFLARSDAAPAVAASCIMFCLLLVVVGGAAVATAAEADKKDKDGKP
jgi:hypothetical protein